MNAIKQYERIYGITLSRRKKFELLLLLVSIEIVLAFSYLGFIELPPISVATMHIIVIVAAMYFGPWEAVVVSLVFSITSIWKATVTSTELGDIIFSPLLSGKPLESLIMAAGTRVVFALVTGYLFRWYFSKERKYEQAGIAIISVVGTLIHSALVYLCMVLFFDAANAETSSGFSEALVLNNVILYALTIFIVLFAHNLIKTDEVQRFFKKTSDGKFELSKSRGKISRILTIVLILICVFISAHFLSRIRMYLNLYGSNYDEAYLSWVYWLILQFISGFIGTFGIVAILTKWMQEYSAALALEANMKARESAEIASKSKTAFLFNMSHDIRTPMNAIIGFNNMAIRDIDDKGKALASLYKVKASSDLLLALINDILDMSRIEAGKVQIVEDDADMYKAFISIEPMLRQTANAKDIRLNFEIKEIQDRYTYVDFVHTERVIVNIISNAIKYTNPGGYVNVSVEQIDRKDDTGIYRFVVADNGIGMSEEFQQHMYEQFAREESSTVSGIQGTGLGLALAKALVEIMNGSISCESKLGVGSTFTVILPFKIRSGVSSSHNETEVKYNLFGKTVLLAEDNEMNKEIAVDILESEGMIVTAVEDGQKVLDVLKAEGIDKFDFILMDIQMPVMNGYESTQQIRKTYSRHIPIIALSANAFQEDKKKSIEMGMDGHIAKPINTKELLDTLTKFQ